MMAKNTISVRIENEKLNRLDELAMNMEKDRSNLINEALDMYLDHADWEREHIMKALEQADRGEFATEEEVAAAFAEWEE
jgi:predicted transcriptional regulator